MSFSIQKDLLKNILKRDDRSVISFKKGGVFSTEYLRSEKSPYKIDNSINKSFKTLTSTSLPIISSDSYKNIGINIERLKLTSETLQRNSDIDSFLSNGVSSVNIVLKKALRQLSVDVDSLYNIVNKVNILLTGVDIYSKSENIVQELTSIKVVLDVLFESLMHEFKDSLEIAPKSLTVDSKIFSKKLVTFFDKGANKTHDRWIDTKNSNGIYSVHSKDGYILDSNSAYLENNLYNVKDDQFTVELFVSAIEDGVLFSLTDSMTIEVVKNTVIVVVNGLAFKKLFSNVTSIAITRDSLNNVYIFVNKVLQKKYVDTRYMSSNSDILSIGGATFKGTIRRLLFLKGDCLYKNTYKNSYEPDELPYKSEIYLEDGDCIVEEKSDFPNEWSESNVHTDGSGFTNKSTHGFVKTSQYQTWINSREDFEINLEFTTADSLEDEVYLLDMGFGCLQLFTDSRDPTIFRLRINNSEDPIITVKTKPNFLEKNTRYRVTVNRNTVSLKLKINDTLISNSYFTGKIDSKDLVVLLNNHAQNTGFNGTLNKFSFLKR